jgi:hypothetical protein
MINEITFINQSALCVVPKIPKIVSAEVFPFQFSVKNNENRLFGIVTANPNGEVEHYPHSTPMMQYLVIVTNSRISFSIKPEKEDYPIYEFACSRPLEKNVNPIVRGRIWTDKNNHTEVGYWRE